MERNEQSRHDLSMLVCENLSFASAAVSFPFRTGSAPNSIAKNELIRIASTDPFRSVPRRYVNVQNIRKTAICT